MTVIRVQSTRSGALGLIEAITESPNLLKANKDQVNTTDLFWDCECKEHYVHPKTQKICLRCFTNCDDQPDSRTDEAARYGLLVCAPIGVYIAESRCAYFLSELVKDSKGNYIPCIAVEGVQGYYVTSWQWGSDKKQAEQIADEFNAGLGLSYEEAVKIQLSTMRF